MPAAYHIVRLDVLTALTLASLCDAIARRLWPSIPPYLGYFDAAFGDPPYGLKFMGKRWDHGVPSAAVWAALLPHLRPGAPVAMFGGTRTYHRLACAIEDSGLEIRDAIFCWLYGQGMVKFADVSKSIDKRLGAAREVIGKNPNERPNRAGKASHATGRQTAGAPVSAAGSPEAARFEGYHANLAPAVEPVCLARKPLDGTLADNALRHGLAGLNVDECRVETDDALTTQRTAVVGYAKEGRAFVGNVPGSPLGRWPSNVILTCDEAICGPGDPRDIEHKPGCHVFELDRQSGVLSSGLSKAGQPRRSTKGGGGYNGRMPDTTTLTDTYGDSGGASRFFYCAKVAKSERSVSAHPCMKPIKLTGYLARLLKPPPRADGQPLRICILFAGSGSEMIGALDAGWDDVLGIEWDAACDNPGKRPDYWADVAEYRLADRAGAITDAIAKPDVVGDKVPQLGLFG